MSGGCLMIELSVNLRKYFNLKLKSITEVIGLAIFVKCFPETGLPCAFQKEDIDFTMYHSI